MSAFEKTLQKNVLKYLRERGHYAVNVPGNAFTSGVPDILSCVNGFWLALELKSADGSLRPLQKVNIRQIRKSGGVAEAVRSIERVKQIVNTIEQGGLWEPGPF